MHEFQLPKDVKAKVSEDGSEITISGKLGSTTKTINTMLLTLKLEGEKLVLEDAAQRKLAKKAASRGNSLCSELKSAAEGVEKGVERKMKIVYAHFPMSVEIKGKEVLVKNIFGEKNPRVARIIGDTKVEVKGQDVHVNGVDEYDVGQTTANITKLPVAGRRTRGSSRTGSTFVQGGMIMVKRKGHPKFQVPNYGAKNRKRVPGRWRKQRGIDNKQRVYVRCHGASPKVGYKNAAGVRFAGRDGAFRLLVYNERDLETFPRATTWPCSRTGCRRGRGRRWRRPRTRRA